MIYLSQITLHRIILGLLVSFTIAPSTFAADKIDAATIYHQYCSVCHGDKGDGQSRARQGLVPPPRDFTTSGLANILTRDAMINIVNDGREGTAMTGWKTRLNNQQVAAVVDYIRATFMQPATASATQSTRGAQIYNYACSVCHGDKGAGSLWASNNMNPAPRDFTQENLPRQRIINAITHGRPGTAMPAFKSQYSATDIASIADYISTSFMPTPKTTTDTQLTNSTTANQTVAYMQQPYPVKLQANIASGEAIYRFNCVTCHGQSGAGNGPRAYFIFPKPRNFLTETARKTFNRPMLFKAVKEGVKGKEMPAWGSVLSDQEIANVSEYVFQTFIHAK